MKLFLLAIEALVNFGQLLRFKCVDQIGPKDITQERVKFQFKIHLEILVQKYFVKSFFFSFYS